MAQSSFFADGETYAEAVVESNDHVPSNDPSQAPSAFYPNGNVYSESNEALAATSATNAANSATNAATSASNALTSEGHAATSETNALASKNAAATSATNAATSESNALAYKNAANTSAGNAATSETNALSSKNAAATSATNAATSETNAAGSASAAATSATNAATSATNAAASVQAAAGTATPLVDGTAAVGTGTKWAHEDHVHPTDTTRAPLASPGLTGVPTAPTASAGTNTTQIATTAFVLANSGVAAIAGKNKLINGGFTVNQRVYASAAALAAGVYGHDRWKAGASGGNYSFTQLASPTTITIAASKSLIQVVEDKNIEGGSYTLSWTGTATARVTINSATPSGNFAVSPITVSGQTAGTTMSVEFTGANAAGTSAVATNTGTLGSAQLELGTTATPFEFRLFPQELAHCKRYLELSYDYGTAPGTITNIGAALFMGTGDAAGGLSGATAYFQQEKRASPTMTAYSPTTGATGNARNNVGSADIAVNVATAGLNSFWWFAPISDANLRVHWKAEAEL